MQINLHNNHHTCFNNYSNTSVTINNTEYSHNLIITEQIIKNFHGNSINTLTIEMLTELLNYQPDLILFGTTNKISYPKAEILLKLTATHWL